MVHLPFCFQVRSWDHTVYSIYLGFCTFKALKPKPKNSVAAFLCNATIVQLCPLIFRNCIFNHGGLYRWRENSFPFFLYLKLIEILIRYSTITLTASKDRLTSKGVAQKLISPRPFEFWSLNGCLSVNFGANDFSF